MAVCALRSVILVFTVRAGGGGEHQRKGIRNRIRIASKPTPRATPYFAFNRRRSLHAWWEDKSGRICEWPRRWKEGGNYLRMYTATEVSSVHGAVSSMPALNTVNHAVHLKYNSRLLNSSPAVIFQFLKSFQLLTLPFSSSNHFISSLYAGFFSIISVSASGFIFKNVT